jgi:hypothetical protein
MVCKSQVKQLHRCLLQPSTGIVSRLSENNHPTPGFKDPWTPWMRLQNLPHWDSEISWTSLRLRRILTPTRRESCSQIEHSQVLTLQMQQ